MELIQDNNLLEIEEQENDWILSKISKKIKLKLSGDEDLFIKSKDSHKFFGRLVKLKSFGLLLFYLGKNLVVLNESMMALLLEKV